MRLAQISTIAAVLQLLLLAPAMDAQQPPASAAGPKRTLKILQRFDERLVKTDQQLVKGEYRKAYREADLLLKEMVNGFISGPGVGRFLGLATVLKAIAAYHLGREGEALWHWHIATQMYPEALNLQLAAYGDVGPFLKENVLSENSRKSDAHREFLVHDEATRADAETRKGGEVVPPRKVRSPMPAFPRAKRGSGRITVRVQVVIKKDGHVYYPRILESQGELTLLYAAFEALRNWRFKPALLNGKPIDVWYNLSFNFSS